MDKKTLQNLDDELDKLEISFDIAVEQGRMEESLLKLQKIVRKNREWRKVLHGYILTR